MDGWMDGFWSFSGNGWLAVGNVIRYNNEFGLLVLDYAFWNTIHFMD